MLQTSKSTIQILFEFIKPGRRVIFAPRKITKPSAQLAANKKRII